MADNLFEHLRRIVDNFVGGRLDYLARYTAVVVGQNSDGTLDVIPDDARVPSAQRVPYRSLPGVTYTVPGGARVLLGYAGGDPARPFVDLWDAGAAVTTLVVAGGTHKAARQGHAVTITVPADAFGAGTPATPVTLSGTITGGSDELLLT